MKTLLISTLPLCILCTVAQAADNSTADAPSLLELEARMEAEKLRSPASEKKSQCRFEAGNPDQVAVYVKNELWFKGCYEDAVRQYAVYYAAHYCD